uniref:CHK kinase-like domain-containing protein n=1 Tax=Panagrolaimus sp. PS1159 TaxID=55785 RepID=A0AC35FCS5_9BILA
MATNVEKDIVDLSKPINGHSFTNGWLLDSLRANDDTFIELHGKRSVKDITATIISEGLGFVSYVYCCKITFTDSKNDDDYYSTILKVPTLKELEKVQGELDESYAERMTTVHKSECNFYQNFARILNIPMPRVFKMVECIFTAKQEGCIHMEDISRRGKFISHFEGVNLSQVKSFIRNLAHMHKNILCATDLEWRGKYLKNATLFGDFVESVDMFIEDFLKKCKIEDRFRPMVTKYRKYTLNKDYYHFANVQAHKDLNMPSVLVHGDMFAGNIMWAKDDNGDIQNEVAAFIDWQIMHEGSPMSDLSCFLTLCVDGVVRRQAEQFAIQYYYDCLVKEFGDAKLVPYTTENLQTSYDYLFMSHAFHTMGLTEFMINTLKEPNQALKDALYDFAILKTLHAWEDGDRLLSGKYKHIFEKYGQ